MTITVLLPAYNATRFLPATMQSVLAQTHREFEFLIIDDGSTDGTLAMLNDWAARDSRIKVVSHTNRGIARTLNDGMAIASGEWIARIDADDIMEPNRLERQIAFLQQNPDVVVASSLVKYINEHGDSIGQNSSYFTSREKIAEFKKNHWPIGFHHPAAIFKKSVIQSLGGYRPEFVPAEDMDLWNRVVDAGYQVLVQGEHLTQYRIHASSVSVGKFKIAEEKAQWVEACILARHQNRAEPTREGFLESRKNLPVTQRFNTVRRNWARAIYKASVFHFSRRNWVRFVPGLATALVLEPWYVLQRIIPQLRKA